MRALDDLRPEWQPTYNGAASGPARIGLPQSSSKANRRRLRMKRGEDRSKTLSRRQFLARTPLALVGGLIVGSVTGRLLGYVFSRKRGYPAFPKGSIFTAAKGRRREF